MDFFYTPPDRISAGHLTIEGDEFAHLTHVMRKKAGDIISVVDGRGTLHEVVIREIARRTAVCEIRSTVRNHGEPFAGIHLAVGILKNSSRFDLLVEKATELGVRSVTPLRTERTIPRHAKQERWQKIALAAMKQSGRSVLPEVRPLATLEDFTRNADAGGVRLILHEKAESPMGPHGPETSVSFCIGPEGGFTDKEIGEAETRGFRPVLIAPRRLRTETAAIVAVARWSDQSAAGE